MKQIDFGGLGGILNQRMIIGSEVPPLSYQQRGFLSEGKCFSSFSGVIKSAVGC
jgi:hypothetical protein